MNKKSLLILGARSDIGIATAHRFAQEGYDILLAARNVNKSKKKYLEIKIKNKINIFFFEFDILKLDSHKKFLNSLPFIPSVVLCAVGLMGDQKKSEKKLSLAKLIIRTNYEGPVNILSLIANYFEKRGSGTLIGISSVAGERGRLSNYFYGSAKAGFTTFLSGLRNRLYSRGVNVITIKPGFINTKMTKNLDLPKFLTTDSQNVANIIYEGYQKKINIIYVKKIWKFIIFLINIIPEEIFKKLKI